MRLSGRTRPALGTLIKPGRGSTVLLDTLAGEPVNDMSVAQGEVIVTDSRPGVRPSDIVTPEERLRYGLGPRS